MNHKVAELSTRELDVIQFLSQGLSNKHIARQLEITERTVKFHCSNLYQKLGVNNRFELIANVYKHESRIEFN